MVCFKDFFARLFVEFQYVYKKRAIIFLKVLYVAYVVQIPFRNVAYYRHEQRNTLKDIGFQIVPEMSEDRKWVSELVFHTLHAIGSVSLMVPWFSPCPHSNGVMGVALAEKWLNCLCVGHTLRFLTYVSTSLPGPASHCRLGSSKPAMNRPTDVITFFSRKSNKDDPNCGDLIFSGHMYQNVILSIIVTVYGKSLFRSQWLRRLVPVAMWSLVAMQVPLIIAARNHYTVDIVVATYLAPLVWIAMERHASRVEVEPMEGGERTTLAL